MKQTLLIGNSKVEIFFESDKDNIKRNLIKVYDIINEIALECEERGIDTSSWFYSKEDIEKIKKDNNYDLL